MQSNYTIWAWFKEEFRASDSLVLYCDHFTVWEYIWLVISSRFLVFGKFSFKILCNITKLFL